MTSADVTLEFRVEDGTGVPDGAVWAAGLALGTVSLVVVAIAYVWFAWALSITYRKLGSPAWRAWVPVVNVAEIFKLGDHAPWKVLLYFLPVINLYAAYIHIVSIHRINVRCGHSAGMTVLGVLLAPVWATILARSHVVAPVPLVDRIAPGAAASSNQMPTVALGSAILADVEEQSSPARTNPAQESHSAPEVFANAPRVHPGAPYAIRPHDSPEPPAPGDAAESAPAPATRDPWSRVASEPVAVAPVQPVPVEITAPPLAPIKDFSLPPDAISALAASMIGRDEDEGAPEPFVDEAEDGETVVVDRLPRIRWILTVEGVGDFRLTAGRVLLGRKPSSSSSGTQALAIPDSTRTLSKLHARLDLDDGSWSITDLNSTNGVLLVHDSGSEELIDAGTSAPVTGRFVLGKVGMTIRYEGESA